MKKAHGENIGGGWHCEFMCEAAVCHHQKDVRQIYHVTKTRER